MAAPTTFLPTPPAAARLARQLEEDTPDQFGELDGVELSGVQLDGDSARGADAAEWTGVRLRGCSTGDFDLAGGFLTDVVINESDLANLPAHGVNFRRVEIRGSRLTGAMLADGLLRDVTFVDCRLDLANLRDVRLERVAFIDCDLSGVLFTRAKLVDVRCESCSFSGAELHHVDITRTRLDGCVLTGARGVSNLAGAWIPLADVLAMAPVFAQACGIVIPPETTA